MGRGKTWGGGTKRPGLQGKGQPAGSGGFHLGYSEFNVPVGPQFRVWAEAWPEVQVCTGRVKGQAGTLPRGEMSRAWAQAPGPAPAAPKALPVPSGHPHSLCGPAVLQQQLPMVCRPAGLPDLRFLALPRHAAWHCARSGYSVNTCSLIYRLERDSWTQKALPCSGPEEEQQVASTAVHGATLSRTFCLLTL